MTEYYIKIGDGYVPLDVERVDRKRLILKIDGMNKYIDRVTGTKIEVLKLVNGKGECIPGEKMFEGTEILLER